jgi:hypothetical protein
MHFEQAREFFVWHQRSSVIELHPLGKKASLFEQNIL